MSVYNKSFAIIENKIKLREHYYLIILIIMVLIVCVGFAWVISISNHWEVFIGGLLAISPFYAITYFAYRNYRPFLKSKLGNWSSNYQIVCTPNGLELFSSEQNINIAWSEINVIFSDQEYSSLVKDSI